MQSKCVGTCNRHIPWPSSLKTSSRFSVSFSFLPRRLFFPPFPLFLGMVHRGRCVAVQRQVPAEAVAVLVERCAATAATAAAGGAGAARSTGESRAREAGGGKMVSRQQQQQRHKHARRMRPGHAAPSDARVPNQLSCAGVCVTCAGSSTGVTRDTPQPSSSSGNDHD